MSATSPHFGRVALVTGANSGIGQAIAARFVAEGMIVGGLDLGAAHMPAGVAPLLADVRDQAGLLSAVQGFASARGRIDVLAHNVAASYVGTVETGSEEEWSRLLDLNVLGQMRVMRATLPWLRRSPAASVVIMSSCSVQNGLRERALYSATKGAAEAMAQAMAADLLTEGIRVNCISPGTVDTPFMAALIAAAPDPAAQRRAYESSQPTGRMVDPAEVAEAALYLAHPANRSVTGTTLTVDGGMARLRVQAAAKT
jgi:2-keto-3-deoxy-L-fuconate dehydrogenase